MTTRARFGIATAGFLFSALLGAGCDMDFVHRGELDRAPPREDPPVEEVRMCQPVVAEVTPEYEAMCRHYCDTLEATLTYAGHNTEAQGAVAQSCWDLRCAPRCATRDVCVQQCHALGVHYQAICADAEIAPTRPARYRSRTASTPAWPAAASRCRRRIRRRRRRPKSRRRTSLAERGRDRSDHVTPRSRAGPSGTALP